MKPWCVGLHCVVIQSLHHHPTMCMCALWCVWIGVCDGACMTNGVCVVVEGDWWYLWLVAWLCHPHVCLFTIHCKQHSPHMPILCCTTPRLPSHWWCTRVAWVCPVHHQEDGKSDELDEGVEHHNGVGEENGCHQTMVCCVC